MIHKTGGREAPCIFRWRRQFFFPELPDHFGDLRLCFLHELVPVAGVIVADVPAGLDAPHITIEHGVIALIDVKAVGAVCIRADADAERFGDALLQHDESEGVHVRGLRRVVGAEQDLAMQLSVADEVVYVL